MLPNNNIYGSFDESYLLNGPFPAKIQILQENLIGYIFHLPSN